MPSATMASITTCIRCNAPGLGRSPDASACDANTVTTYTDANGAPLKLTPGQTWLELPKPGNGSLN